MDFDAAERRLAKEQSKLRSRAKQKQFSSSGGFNGNNRTSTSLSIKAKREAEIRRRQYEERKLQRLRQQQRLEYVKAYMSNCDDQLGTVRHLGGTNIGSDGGSNDGFTGSTVGIGMGLGGTDTKTSSDSYDKKKGLTLRPTSIHGDGDKIALPPSVLAALTEKNNDDIMAMMGAGSSSSSGSPLLFRIGILNDKYEFPMSDSMKTLMESAPIDQDDQVRSSFYEDYDDVDEEQAEDGMMMKDDDDDGKKPGERGGTRHTQPYLDELSLKYISYTHGTVVEFTQDEGKVGLPASIASALLDPKRQRKPKQQDEGDDGKKQEGFVKIPITRTVDPAFVTSTIANDNVAKNEGKGSSGDNTTPMDVDTEHVNDTANEEEKTPGHLAYGAFDVPDVDVEITLVKLPKGKGCTLIPTKEAILNGFHTLKDVKLVLEQSLIRTRATLSVGDIVHTWHRGVKFDLRVSSVTPADFNAVTCINTDIEVDIGPSDEITVPTKGGQNDESSSSKAHSLEEKESSFAPGVGRTLMDSSDDAPRKVGEPLQQRQHDGVAHKMLVDPKDLRPEPPADLKDGVCTVQIRSREGASGRRRFDLSASTMKDLFLFAAYVCNMSKDEIGTFRLVTRFPRRVFSINDTGGDGGNTLAEGGIEGGQEMFMVERI